MTPSFATSLDALGGWRAALGERAEALARFLDEHDLAHGEAAEQIAALRERLGNEKLVVAFVAEFSRGKSELINAIFFADTGRRILPATPGRTTMCPVELGWRGDEPASLLLLPIETRLEGLSLGEMRAQPRAWRRLALDIGDADQLARVAAGGDAHRVGHRGAGARARLLGRRDARRQPAARRRRQGRGARPGATPSSTIRIRFSSRAWSCSTRRA